MFRWIAINVSTPFLGFIIYFAYGIRNSAEAVLTKSSPDDNFSGYKPACTLNGEPMAIEKEAFLQNRLDAVGDDEEEDS